MRTLRTAVAGVVAAGALAFSAHIRAQGSRIIEIDGHKMRVWSAAPRSATSHDIPRDDPDLVVWAIRRTVDMLAHRR